MMKKTLSWILALMIIVSTISCIGVSASAASGGVRYFTIKLAKDGKVLPYNQEYELDFKSEDSYLTQCYNALEGKGTEIRVYYTDGTDVTYTSNGKGAFVNGGTGIDFIDDLFGLSTKIYRDVMFIDSVSVNGTKDDHFVVCLTNGLRHSVPVDVINYPVDFPLSITYKPTATPELIKNCCGEYDANGMFIYEPKSIASVDDCLELFYFGRGIEKYYFDGEGWFNEDGEELPGEIAINQADCVAEQYAVNGWEIGKTCFLPLTYSYNGQAVSTFINVDIVESPYKSVKYIANTPVKVYENSCGYYGDNGYYVYDEELCLVIPGNEIVVTYQDDAEETYHYDELGNLVDAYDTLVDTTHFVYSSNQDVAAWNYGAGNEVTLNVYGVETTVDVEIVDNIIASIEFASADVLRLVEGVDGYAYKNSDGDDAFYYDCSNILLVEGNQILVNFTDGTSKVYTFIGDDYATDDGEILGLRYLELVTDQDIYGKEWFANNIYDATLIYMGAMTDIPVKIIPAKAPTAPVVKLSSGEKGVVVKWEKIDSAESYNVYRRLSGETKWTLLGSTDKVKFVDTTVKNNKKYDYKVVAKNDQGTSKFKVVSITYLAAPVITNVVNLAKGVRIEWNAVKGAKSYRIYRKADGAKNWELLAETTEVQYLDKSVVNATNYEYTYTVRSMKGKIFGAYDTKGETIIRIAKPFVKTAEKTDAGVLVTWKATVGAEEYYVYRKNLNAKNPVWKKLGTVVGKNNTTFLDTTADMSGLYRYTVRAYAKGTLSSFMLGPIYGAPDKPVLSKVANKYDGVQITWESAKRADSYNVYRKVKGGSWTLIAEGVTKTTYVDTTAPNGKYVYYTVSGVNEVGESKYNTKGLVRFFVKAPALKSATYTEDNGVKLSWNKVSGAEEYRVYRRTAGGSWKLIETTSRTTFVDGSVRNNSYYVYTVRAVRNGWFSGYNTKGIAVNTVEEKDNF